MKGKAKPENTYAKIYNEIPSKIRNKYEKKPWNTHQSSRRMKKNYQNKMNKKDKQDKIPQFPEGINDCILCGGWPGFIYARLPIVQE